jgi:hypothetical protein
MNVRLKPDATRRSDANVRPKPDATRRSDANVRLKQDGTNHGYRSPHDGVVRWRV